jgi:hypothetical protein
MSTIAWIILSSVATALVCALIFLLTRARGTPYLKLEPDEYPEIKDALPLIAGLTESSVHEGNSAAVLQNGAIFPRCSRTSLPRLACTSDVRVVRGKLETQFVDALSERARAVNVRVLIDCLGASKASEPGRAVEAERSQGVGLQPDRVLHDRGIELPDTSQDAGHRWRRGIHWRHGCRGPVARQRYGSRALARHRRAARGARRARATIGVRAELGRRDALPAGRGGMFPRARAHRRNLGARREQRVGGRPRR